MYHRIINSESFFQLLFEIDQNLTKETKNKGCPYCHSPIHVANYMRKPRGMKIIAAIFCLRFSFCCSRDGCRKRVMPPSTRFLGRFVYSSTWVILISAMTNGMPKRRRQLARIFGVDIKTIKRWRSWWTKFFPTTKFWKNLRGNIMEEVINFPEDILKIIIRQNRSSEDALKEFLKMLKDLREQNI